MLEKQWRVITYRSVNCNPIKDCELVAAPSSHVVQWLECMGSSSQGPWVWFMQFHFTSNMCLLQAEASRCKQINKTGKVWGSSWPHIRASGRWPGTAHACLNYPMVSFYLYKLSTSFTKLCGQDVGYDWECLVHNSYPGEATSAWRVTAVLFGECNLSGCYPWQPTGMIWLLSNIQQIVL